MQIIVNHGFRDKSINAADLGWRKRMRGNRRAATWGSWALEEDLFGGDHGEARAVVVPLDGVAELGLRAALDGAPGEAGVREAAGAGGGGNLVLVAVVVEAVLDHRPEAARDNLRRKEGAEVVAVVLLELDQPELVRLPRRPRRRQRLSLARRVR